MSASSPFAERSVDLLGPSGERVAFRVEFGPILPEGRDFRCRLRFCGWSDSPPDVFGRDSLEAFLHAVTLVHGVLHQFIQEGGRVLWPGTTADYGLEHFVTSPEWRRAELAAAPNRRLARQRKTRTPRRGGGR
jgi:hypothetical protein